MYKCYKESNVLLRFHCFVILLQAENEESMMRWMRIIHNLNRMRRMGPLPPHLQNVIQ